jgi:hypothetical protein
MSRWSIGSFNSLRRLTVSGRLYRGPVIWIAVLLGGWLAITEWPAVASSVLSLTH